MSAGLVAVGIWIFLLACRYLPIFPEGAMAEEERVGRHAGAAEAKPVSPVPGAVTAFDHT